MVRFIEIEKLPEVLRDMAAYLEQSCYKSEYIDYLEEIIKTGLFQDAEGIPGEIDDELGIFPVRTEY
jgi:hypothetical protein